MRQFLALITILLAFLLAPLACDFFAAPVISWWVAILVIAHETWVAVVKKTPKDLAEEKKRLEEARRRVEQIKQEAAMVYLQPGKKESSGSKLDVDRMSPAELAMAARAIVDDIRGKKDGGAGAPVSKAA